jgi:predicted glycogen debranching enzyme
VTIDAREWLEADGQGGYAMGTVDGIRTRRYHGLLLVAVKPPEGRMLLVADLEVTLATARGTYALSSHRYRGDVVFPDGHVRLAAFTSEPWPRWEWACEDGTRVALELAVCPAARSESAPLHSGPGGHARTVLRWTRLAGTGSATLAVRPLLAGRDYHATHHENGAFRFAADARGERVTWRPYDGVPAICALANARYDHAPDWYRHFVLDAERERGLDYEEDLATPGTFVFDLAAGQAALAFAAGAGPELERGGLSSTGGVDGESARDLVDRTFAAELARRAAFPTELDRAASQYIAGRGTGQTVIAGFPWFCDWGRDTFVSLRGLCLATGQRDVARRILLQWGSAVSEGMLPNRYSEHDKQPEYNTVDAALWFAIAADAYLGSGAADVADRRALEDAIAQIVAGYARGTRHRIGATDDGLLACGEPGLQLTWMDAKVNGDVITPRIGKPVEVQALWLNVLAIAGRRDARWRAHFERGRAAFVARFWDGELGQLHDVVDCDHVAGTVDRTCRPNQIFAVGGLPLALLDDARAHAVVDTAFRRLWTVAGPRSLAEDDPRYRGRYGGDREHRDRAYHNGPTWPWLAGAFVEAWVRVRGGGDVAKREARARFLEPLLARRVNAGLGHLSEICDGDPPHDPRGCPFQAWSVAEALRLDRDVLAAEPTR